MEFRVCIPEVLMYTYLKRTKMKANVTFTGKSLSEALILALVSPQYDTRLFIEFSKKYKLRTCSVQKLFFVFFCFDMQNNICPQNVLNLYFLGNSMNNLLSYDSRMIASDKDLPLIQGRLSVNIYVVNES